MNKYYDDLETFFRTRKIRQRYDGSWMEDSFDFGVWWMAEDGVPRRLTWIGPEGREEGAVPGELYLLRLGGPTAARFGEDGVVISAGPGNGAVEFLGIVPPSEGTRTQSNRPWPDAIVEKLLDGWPDHCGQRGGVRWLYEQMEKAIADGIASAP